MILQLFSPPGEGVTLQSCKLGEICDAISFEFEKFFCGAGTFTLEIPANSNCADRIGVNTLIYSREDDMCFITKNLKKTENTLKITGYDLNGMLLDRLTLPPLEGSDNPGEADDKDAVSGSTETCVKHFVEYNMISSPENARNYPRFAIEEDKGRGLSDDRNYCGKECVEDVVRIMCEGAELGYRIRLDAGQQAADKPLILFDVCERVDKSANQSERNRVIFSAGLKNVAQTEREVGITAHKNVLWCEAGSIHDGFVYEQDGVIPAAWGRREEYVSISVADKDNPEDIVLYGRKEMSDKFAQTDSLVIEAGNPLDFGVVYGVGDIVTAYDPEKKVQLDSVISAATVKRSGTEYSVKLTLGESKPKLLDGYASQSDLIKKNQRDYPAAQISGSSSGSALTEYEYISDLSVKYNGVTYTVEKDSATGLISRISDSAGGEFKPKINSGITDTALHNAVFMAIAMHSGLSGISPLALYDRGNLCEDVTGGWEIVVRPNTLYEYEFRENCIYLKTKGWSGNINYNYIFAQTANAIDLTAYRTLHITLKSTADKFSDIVPSFGTSAVKITPDMTDGSGGACKYAVTNGAERTIDLDISKITGHQYVYIKLGEYNTVYAYKIWAD